MAGMPLDLGGDFCGDALATVGQQRLELTFVPSAAVAGAHGPSLCPARPGLVWAGLSQSFPRTGLISSPSSIPCLS